MSSNNVNTTWIACRTTNILLFFRRKYLAIVVLASCQRTVLSAAAGEGATAEVDETAAPPNMLPTVTAATPLQANTDTAPEAAVAV